MSNALKRRVEKIEADAQGNGEGFAVVIQREGETDDDMRARWEVENSRSAEGLELMVFVKPFGPWGNTN